MAKLKKHLLLTVVFLLMTASPGWTQAPPGASGEGVQVGRIAHVEGQLLRYVPEEKDWVATVKDAPFGLDDSLYSEAKAKAELIMPNNTRVRVGGNTQIQLITLRMDVTELDMASGTARLYNRSTSGVIKATSPYGYVVAPAGAVFDLYVGDQSLEVIALKGKVAFVGNRDQTRYDVVAGSLSLVSDGRQATSGQGNVDAEWDDWNADRDRLWSKRTEVKGESVRYLPPALQDDAYSLDENGRWERVYYEGGYRNFWRPVNVAVGWEPYTMGRWTVYYGDHCWVPHEPFGYVTHHYGNWVFVDRCNCWYWAPPVMGVGVSIGPFLPIPFGWYPGRVGWIYSGLNVGWIPLAPFETYYCHRPWGPRSMVVNNGINNININRYRYINRAVIVHQNNFYNVNNYQNVRITNINNHFITNNFRAAPIIDGRVIPNYARNPNRYHFTDAGVERKPHDMVVDRITRNGQLAKPEGGLNANLIQRRVAAVQPGKPLADLKIESPRISDKFVSGNEANTPRTDLQFQQRDLKLKTRPPSEVAAEGGPAPDGRLAMPESGSQTARTGQLRTMPMPSDGRRAEPSKPAGEPVPGQSGQTGQALTDGQRIRLPRPNIESLKGQSGQFGQPLTDGRRVSPPKLGAETPLPEAGQAKPVPGDTRKTSPSAPQQTTRPASLSLPGQPLDQSQGTTPVRPGGDRQPSKLGLMQPPNDNVQKVTPLGSGRESRPSSSELQRQTPSGGVRNVRPPESRQLKARAEGRKESPAPQTERPSGRVGQPSVPPLPPSGRVGQPSAPPQPSSAQGRSPVQRQIVNKPQPPAAADTTAPPRAQQSAPGGGKGKQIQPKGPAEP